MKLLICVAHRTPVTSLTAHLCAFSVISATWTTGNDPPPQYVQFGTASGVYGAPVAATQSVTYTSNSICGTFASQNSFIDPGTFFTANMTGLLPATIYYYRVGALVGCKHALGASKCIVSPLEMAQGVPGASAQTTTSSVSQEYFFTSPPLTSPQSSVKVSRGLVTAGDGFPVSRPCSNDPGGGRMAALSRLFLLPGPPGR